MRSVVTVGMRTVIVILLVVLVGLSVVTLRAVRDVETAVGSALGTYADGESDLYDPYSVTISLSGSGPPSMTRPVLILHGEWEITTTLEGNYRADGSEAPFRLTLSDESGSQAVLVNEMAIGKGSWVTRLNIGQWDEPSDYGLIGGVMQFRIDAEPGVVWSVSVAHLERP